MSVPYPVEAPRVACVAGVRHRDGGRHRRSLRVAVGVLALGSAVATAGCSMSVPMASFVADPLATGSVDRPDAPLFSALDQEDGRRARAALAVALDPQGNGASVAWGNPQSGAKGSFAAATLPFTANRHVCRAFTAHVIPDAKTDRAVEGSACRDAEGEWFVSDAREITSAEASGRLDGKKGAEATSAATTLAPAATGMRAQRKTT